MHNPIHSGPRRSIATLAVVAAAATAHVQLAGAELHMAPLFTDHMVLQRDSKLPIWGTANPGESITVDAGGLAKAQTKADDQGRWRAILDPLHASDRPMDVTIAGASAVTLHDVLVGDVWICSGQSNMGFSLGDAHNASVEVPKAGNPTLRLFKVKAAIAFEPQMQCSGSWQISSPETAKGFSAVGYFFGKDIQEDQHVPVGLISCAYGGQPAQAFTSLDGLKADSRLSTIVESFLKLKGHLAADLENYRTNTLPAWQKSVAEWKRIEAPQQAGKIAEWEKAAAAARLAGRPSPPRPPSEPRRPFAPDETASTPTVLFNGMISPLVPAAIKGVIWYQGEANTWDAATYEALFPALIDDWRSKWSAGDFPFIWVQLANYHPRAEAPTQKVDGWPRLREAQSQALRLPRTGQAVTIDIGAGDTVHPRDKADVGHRLALAARHVAYGEDLVFSGPTYDHVSFGDGKAVVSFTHTGSGLMIDAPPSMQIAIVQTEPAAELKGFSVAGEDHAFVWAKATIDGDHVTVSSASVAHPVAVRYAWADNPEANLYNKEHLPASPFRTDDYSQ